MILSFESFSAGRANISSLITVSEFVFCKSTRGTKCFPTLLTLYFRFCSSVGRLWLALHFSLSVFSVFRVFSRWWSRATAVTFYSWRICWSSLLQAGCRWNYGMNRACTRLGTICRIWKMKLTSYVSPQNIHQSKPVQWEVTCGSISSHHMVLVMYLHRYTFSDLSSKHEIFAAAIHTADNSLQKMKTDVIRYMYQITDCKLEKFLWLFKPLQSWGQKQHI